jgi:hypothetical protein
MSLHFTSHVGLIISTLYELRPNRTSDPFWWRSQLSPMNNQTSELYSDYGFHIPIFGTKCCCLLADRNSQRSLYFRWLSSESDVNISQECTNPGRQAAMATNFCKVAPNICGSYEWNLFDVTLLAPRIFRWLLDFWKNFALLLCSVWSFQDSVKLLDGL